MGQYRFSIPNSQLVNSDSLAIAQMIGLDGVPWPCKTIVDNGELVIHRSSDFSGRLLVPLRTKFGSLALISGTLPETDEPYCLLLELARGTLSRLRNQISLWQEGGLVVPGDLLNELDQITRSFADGIFLSGADQAEKRVQICEPILEKAVELMFAVTNEFSNQVEQIRREQKQPVSVVIGATGPTQAESTPVSQSPWLNIVEHQLAPQARSDNDNLEIDFSSIDQSLSVFGAGQPLEILGPLIDFSQDTLPGWLESDWPFEKRVQVASALCRKLGERYTGKLRVVHAVAGINGVGQQHFNYPQQLQIALEMLESLDHQMPNTSLMVSFDQPWGERLAMANGATQAIEIADSLMRYGARISVLGLEINLDYFPQGSIARDPFQWVDLIDRWSQFGLPIVVTLCAPFASGKSAESRYAKTVQKSFNEPQTVCYLETVIQMMSARPTVSAICWRHYSDRSNVRFPHSGLLDQDGNAKPFVEWFGRMVSDNRKAAGDQKTVIQNL